jgi:acetyl-CoA acetyltransferase family protein
VDAYLIDAVRTPFGKHRGGLSGIRTDDLAALPLAALLERQPGLDPATIDDVILGDTNGAGEDNRNVARMAALLAGLPETVPGVTVNRLCASGGEAITQAARAIRAGDLDTVVAGGVESMSRAPFVLPKPDVPFPTEAKLYHTQVGWRMVNPRFPQRWTASLGAAAEAVAAELGIDRAAQDDWALRSHQRAAAAWDKGLHDDYVMAVEEVSRDESIRPDTTAAKLAALRPAFSRDGAVTAGNASPVNDGALAVLVGSRSTVDTLGAQPLGRVVAATTVAVTPERFSVAPVPAIRKVLARAGLGFDDIAVWEINEAFAAMVLSCLSQLPEIDPEKVNPHGGAIAIGHPLGASAPRVIVDACRELRRRGGGYAVAAACIGVGQGTAMVVRVD